MNIPRSLQSTLSSSSPLLHIDMILLLKIKDENTISRICEDGRKHDFEGVLVAENGFQKHRQKHRGGAISPQSGDIAKLRQIRQLTYGTLPPRN